MRCIDLREYNMPVFNKVFGIQQPGCFLLKSKYLVFGILLMFLQISLKAQEEPVNDELHHCFFKEKSISLGVGTSYSLPLELAGLNLRGYYNFGEQLCIGPEISYFKSEEVKVLEFNAIGHYIFETSLFGVSPIAGVNYTIEEFIHEHEEGFGLVLGAGIHRNFNRVTVFTEYIKVIGQVPDDFVNVGLMYSFDL